MEGGKKGGREREGGRKVVREREKHVQQTNHTGTASVLTHAMQPLPDFHVFLFMFHN